MALWFIFAMMTAAAVFAVLWPLGRESRAGGGSDVEVYRDQLAELDRDRAAQLVGDKEYDAARTEVARRLIAAADAAGSTVPAGSTTWRRRAVALTALIALPVGAALAYAALGSPSVPDAPLAARKQTPLAQRSIQDLVAQVETHLETNPEDGRGWEVVAPVYMRLGRFDDAVKARANVLRLSGSTAEREADYGEALIAAANGIVTGDARAAFERAVRHDSANLKARYFLGLAAEQEGKRERAAELWRDLLAKAPADAPWVGLVRESLTRVAPGEGKPNASGPSSDDVAAAASLSPEERNTMVRGMVDRLASRLRENGDDLEGWQRLMRAYVVLGERDKAKAAAADARRAIATEPEKVRQIDELSRTLGLGDT